MSLVSGRMDVKELRRVLSIFSHFANTSSYVDTYIGSKKCPTQLGAFQCSKDPPLWTPQVVHIYKNQFFVAFVTYFIPKIKVIQNAPVFT